MLAGKKEQILAAFNAYMTQCGVPNSRWYAGIANDHRRRLFVEHNVSQENGMWAYNRAVNREEARDCVLSLTNAGCDGNPDGADDKAPVYVYLYVKTPRTDP